MEHQWSKRIVLQVKELVQVGNKAFYCYIHSLADSPTFHPLTNVTNR